MSSRAIKAARAFVEVFMDDDDLQRGLKRMQTSLKSVAKNVGRIGLKLLAVSASIAAVLAAPVEAASDLQETMNKFNVVFGKNAESMKKWGDQFANEVGRSEEQIARFLSDTQDLLVPAGIDPDAAQKMSKTLTGLAVDVASFNNKIDDDVLRDFHGALTGGGETVKKYGVIMSVATTNAQLLASGIDPKAATDAQKVQARLNVLLKGTTAAQGDAIRSGAQWANVKKRITGQLSNMAAVIGKALIPSLEKIGEFVAEYLPMLTRWIERNQGLVKGVAILGVAIGVIGGALAGVSAIIFAASAAIGGAVAVAGALSTAFTFLALSPVGWVVAAVAMLIATMIYLESTGVPVLETLQVGFVKLHGYIAELLVDLQSVAGLIAILGKSSPLGMFTDFSALDSTSASDQKRAIREDNERRITQIKASQSITESLGESEFGKKLAGLFESLENGTMASHISDKVSPRRGVQNSQDLRTVGGFAELTKLINGGGVQEQQLRAMEGTRSGVDRAVDLLEEPMFGHSIG